MTAFLSWFSLPEGELQGGFSAMTDFLSKPSDSIRDGNSVLQYLRVYKIRWLLLRAFLGSLNKKLTSFFKVCVRGVLYRGYLKKSLSWTTSWHSKLESQIDCCCHQRWSLSLSWAYSLSWGIMNYAHTWQSIANTISIQKHVFNE